MHLKYRSVSKIKEPEETKQPGETTEVVVHIQPESKKRDQRPPNIKKTPSRVSNKIQEDFDKISVDLEAEEPIPNPIQVEESKGKEQLIKEIATKSRNKSSITCLPSLIFIGVFLMFASVVVMTYWLTKK